MIHVAIDPPETAAPATGRTRPRRHSTMQVFAWPLLLGLASCVGLVLGLTGDGMRDVACWILLGLAPLVIIRALARAAIVRAPARAASSPKS